MKRRGTINLLLKDVFNTDPTNTKLSKKRQEELRSLQLFPSQKQTTITTTGGPTTRTTTAQEELVASPDLLLAKSGAEYEVVPDLRFVVFDKSYLEGIDLIGVKYMWFLQRPSTRDQERQGEGRIGRRCSAKNLVKENGFWRIKVNIVELQNRVRVPNWMLDDNGMYRLRQSVYNGDDRQRVQEYLQFVDPDRYLRNYPKDSPLWTTARFSPLNKSMFVSFEEEDRRQTISTFVKNCAVVQNFMK